VERTQLKKYLLGQLSELDEEQVELRLLTDADYVEKLDIAVNELIEQYADEKLTAGDVERMEQHFFNHRERRDKLKVALALKKYRERKRWFTRPLSFYLPIAASVLLAAGLSFVLWQVYSRPSDVDKGLIALHTAFQEQRPLEPRLTGFEKYAPASTRGPQDRVNSVSLDLAGKLLLSAADEHPNATTHHALGQYYLAQHRLDDAIKQFNAALSLDPQNAQTYSDLGAALLEKGKIQSEGEGPEPGKGVEDYARSLDYLNKALELNGSLREALFNRALCHEYMMLPQLAEEDWRKYLEADSNSPWADEARQHLSVLKEQQQQASQNKEQLWQNFLAAYQAQDEERMWEAVDRSSCRIGNCIVERLADDALRQSAEGRREEAEASLQMLSHVGELKSRRAGDLYVLDLAHCYKNASPLQRSELSQARELVKSGQEKIVGSDFKSALELYEKSGQMFERAGDACEARLAEYWAAICYSQLEQEEESVARLSQLTRLCEDSKYQWLLVRSLNALADYQFSTLHEYSTAIASGSKSAKIAEGGHDTYGLLSALAFLIELYRYLGNYDQSLDYVLRALPVGGAHFLEPKQIWLKYNQVSWTLNSLGLYAAAVDFQKSALQLALELGEFSMICTTYARLGVVYAGERHFDEGFDSVQQAVNLAETRSSEAVGQQMLAYASLQMGDIYSRAGDFERAIASYNRSIGFYEKQNSPTFIYQAHKGMLLSYIAAGNLQAAQTELASTLTLYKKHRANISEQSNRNSFSDLEQDVFDVAIDFEYSSMKNPESAFDYSETSRASSLLDLIHAGTSPKVEAADSDLILPPESQPVGLAAIREQMPEQAQIIQYAVLENKILVWVISKMEFKYAEVKIDQGTLNQLVQEYLRQISNPVSNADETSRLAKQLYGILIQPIESFISKNGVLCIVPDKILNYTPYAALISPTTGRYLVEDYALFLSPSSNTFLSCSKSERTNKRTGTERVLSIGNPDFDREIFKDLPTLPEAEREAREIASYYESADVFTWNRAIKSEIIKAMTSADVINIASHSLVDESFPMRSKILLAKRSPADSSNQGSDEALSVSEIYQMQLPRARLVVLSSCQTGIGRSYRGEGAMSIARPFLALGVPEVVASLWSVESASTAEVMINFHKCRKREGLSTVEALRQAQLAMLHSPRQLFRQPYYWASFNLIGSYANF
jgi:CHAT domain-containing protein/lipoprotein NlpI